ncbi:MAG: nuclear transport factor 2 family protein [Candidatus Promineifilaceae bacterium]|nr:nuclear transport factor 2 family protein [Candidatus Promineifilaceae bacterium]
MSRKLDVIREYTESIGIGGNREALADYFSDDFQMLDKAGNFIMNKEMLLGGMQQTLQAFTDYGFVLNDVREEGDFVIMSGHFEGTHTGDLDLSAMGIGVIPASGKKVVWPEASEKISVEGDKIIRMEPYSGASGMQAWLAALGVEPPSE